jgi:hypothetical protein
VDFIDMMIKCYPPIATAAGHNPTGIGDYHHHPTMPLRFNIILYALLRVNLFS